MSKNPSRKFYKKKRFWFIIVLIIAIGAVAASSILGAGAKNITMVTGTKVKEDAIAYKIFTRGDVQSKQIIDIVPKVSGRVQTIFVKEGDMVKKGDPLLSLDVEELQNQLQDLEVEMAISKASLAQLTMPSSEVENSTRTLLTAQFEQAKKDYANAQSLFQAGSYSESQVIQAKTAMQNAEQAVLNNKNTKTAEKTTSERNIQNMRINALVLKKERLLETIKDANLLSPADGTVTKIAVKVLDVAQQNMPVVTLQDTKNLEITTNINQFDISKVKIGQDVKVTADGLGDKVYQGKISKISAVAQKSVSGQGQETVVPVVIDLDNSSGDFKPNYAAKIEIVIASQDKAMVVPYEAVRIDKDKQRFVYVVINQKLEERKITTGIESDLALQVTSDNLKVGDVLVLNPNENHVNGLAVVLTGVDGE